MESNDVIKVGKQVMNTSKLKQIYLHGLSRINIVCKWCTESQWL